MLIPIVGAVEPTPWSFISFFLNWTSVNSMFVYTFGFFLFMDMFMEMYVGGLFYFESIKDELVDNIRMKKNRNSGDGGEFVDGGEAEWE